MPESRVVQAREPRRPSQPRQPPKPGKHRPRLAVPYQPAPGSTPQRGS